MNTIDEHQRVYKIPEYQRRASSSYYYRNRETILEKQKQKRIQKIDEQLKELEEKIKENKERLRENEKRIKILQQKLYN